jgi:hypothetical protein
VNVTKSNIEEKNIITEETIKESLKNQNITNLKKTCLE